MPSESSSCRPSFPLLCIAVSSHAQFVSRPLLSVFPISDCTRKVYCGMMVLLDQQVATRIAALGSRMQNIVIFLSCDDGGAPENGTPNQRSAPRPEGVVVRRRRAAGRVHVRRVEHRLSANKAQRDLGRHASRCRSACHDLPARVNRDRRSLFYEQHLGKRVGKFKPPPNSLASPVAPTTSQSTDHIRCDRVQGVETRSLHVSPFPRFCGCFYDHHFMFSAQEALCTR